MQKNYERTSVETAISTGGGPSIEAPFKYCNVAMG